MGFRRLGTSEKKLQFGLTESARMVRLYLGSVVPLVFTMSCRSPEPQTNDANLDGFPVHKDHSRVRAT